MGKNAFFCLKKKWFKVLLSPSPKSNNFRSHVDFLLQPSKVLGFWRKDSAQQSDSVAFKSAQVKLFSAQTQFGPLELKHWWNIGTLAHKNWWENHLFLEAIIMLIIFFSGLDPNRTIKSKITESLKIGFHYSVAGKIFFYSLCFHRMSTINTQDFEKEFQLPDMFHIIYHKKGEN